MDNFKSSENSKIAEFYSGRSVFITGATGFLGKVIVEKVLRSCPNVENVYVLMRPKKDQIVSERYKDIISVPLFDKLREENPQQLMKIIPIAGDIEQDRLGISDADRKLLCDKVSVVLHSAATVNFNEPLKNAVKINLAATNDILNLCRELKDFQAYTHISTTYVSGRKLHWKEELNLSKYDPEEIIELARKTSVKDLKKMEAKLLEGFPNTYTFTKSLAEVLITKKAKEENLPVAILRPSNIISTMDEPMPGWIDNSYGPTGPMLWMAKGIFRVMPCNIPEPVPMIPVDLVSNAAIAVAWKTAMDRKPGDIYSICISCTNPITWSNFWDMIQERVRKYPLTSNPVWYPAVTLRNNNITYAADYFASNILPAFFFDSIGIFKGKKFENIKAQLFLLKYSKSLKFFVASAFKFPTENMPRLISAMSPKDQVEFKCDPRQINWNTYLTDYVLGVRRYILKKPDKTLAIDKAKVSRLRTVHYFVKFACVLLPLVIAGGELYRRTRENEFGIEIQSNAILA